MGEAPRSDAVWAGRTFLRVHFDEPSAIQRIAMLNPRTPWFRVSSAPI